MGSPVCVVTVTILFATFVFILWLYTEEIKRDKNYIEKLEQSNYDLHNKIITYENKIRVYERRVRNG